MNDMDPPKSKEARLEYTCLLDSVPLYLTELVKQFLKENFSDKTDPVTLGDGIQAFLIKNGIHKLESRSASFTVETNFRNYKKPTIIFHMKDEALLSVLCRTYTRRKKETTDAIKAALKGNSLSSMTAMELKNLLYQELPELPEFRHNIDTVIRTFESLQRFELHKSKFKAHCPSSPGQSKRIFYLVDMLFPTKMEVILHHEDVSHPPEYDPVYLCPHLKPTFKNVMLINGKYEIVGSTSTNAFYMYIFEKTIAASDASADSLEMSRVVECSGKDILPKTMYKLAPYDVAKEFVAYQDAMVLMKLGVSEALEQGRVQGRVEVLNIIQTVDVKVYERVQSQFHSPNPNPPSAPSSATLALSGTKWPLVKGDEITRNQHLAMWVLNQLEKTVSAEDFVIKNDEKNDKRISRFGRSRDDFCFFPKPTQGRYLYGASVSEEVELIGVDGDCKEKAKAVNKYQLVANLNKCAADIAFAAATEGVLFSKITVFGLLVDYNTEKVTKVFRLDLDFNERKSMLQSEDTAHSITDAFSSAFTALTKAICRV